MTFGFEVGTGGASTVAYLRKRGNKGYPLASYSVSETAEDATVNRTPAQNLAQIRAVLKPAVTELADILRVSRQAVYDWQAGKPIAPDNAARLADIARAADAFALEGLSGNREILARAITEGKNFYDLIRDGRAADAAARALIEIVGVEMRQREALRKRLAARKRPAREAFEDIGAPHLEERG
jgi:transcriptional regulator with XRE-family HTH domain